MPKCFSLTIVGTILWILYAARNPEAMSRWIRRVPFTHARFISFLIEDYAGNFPLWLAPTSVRPANRRGTTSCALRPHANTLQVAALNRWLDRLVVDLIKIDNHAAFQIRLLTKRHVYETEGPKVQWLSLRPNISLAIR